MAFNGVNVPDLTWRDYERGTSFGSDLTRLIGGGLWSLGGIKREEEKRALEREDRLAREKRLDQQFQMSHDQSERHFQTTRADRWAERANEANEDLVEQGEDGQWRPVAAPTRATVPQVMEAGRQSEEAAYQAWKKQEGIVCEAGSH